MCDTNLAGSFCLLSFSYFGSFLHLNTNPQLKPPLFPTSPRPPLYLSVLKLMLSMTGHTTVLLFRWILSNSGSAHCLLHSQCESKNTITSPVATSAPAERARIRPSLFSRWTICILGCGEIQSSRVCLRSSVRERGPVD